MLAVGFEQVGTRLARQVEHLNGFNIRLHEINEALTTLLQKHDVVISVRTLAAKRRHQALSNRCLALAAKVQVLRNRGYAMSAEEEDLKGKLLMLERAVFDPALHGRSEEIWARMMGIRERAKGLQEDLERSTKDLADDQQNGVIDEAMMKKAAKVCRFYSFLFNPTGYLFQRSAPVFFAWLNRHTPGRIEPMLVLIIYSCCCCYCSCFCQQS